MKTIVSSQLFKKAVKVMVGGVNSPVRAFNAVGGSPLIMHRGKGSRLVDVDGNVYTDYCLSWGALILGHDHPQVRKAAGFSLTLGSSFGTTTKPEIDLAQFICKNVPSVEQIRFVNSGTEATMSAIRLARAFTKRQKVLKFDGCYHGHADDLLASAGSGVANLPASSSQGIPQDHLNNTLSIPYNDINRLTHVIERHHQDIACVIIEPVAGNMGVIVPDLRFLKTIRQLTKNYGIVLIFDEVMSGFRPGLSCVQGDFGIIPDLTCLGKIIGGGYPIGAYGGRKDIMSHLAPLGKTYQAGTFAGNPLVMRCGLAVLKNLNSTLYRCLNKMCSDFVMSTNMALRSKNLNAHLVNYHSMISIRFQKDPVRDYAQALLASQDPLYASVFHHLLMNAIYWPPANLETFFVSAKHTKYDLKKLSLNIIKGIENFHEPANA